MDDKTQGIRFRAIIEILGKPKSHVEETIRKFVEKIKDDHEFIVLKESFAEPQQHESLWSTFTELEVVSKDITKLIGFCFEYMPASVEIIKPENFSMENHVVTGFLNDLQGRLHNVDMIVKRLRGENDVLKRNMKMTIENLITILLKINSMNLDELSVYTGINKDELKSVLSNMVENKKLKHEQENYSLLGNEK